MNDTSNLGVNNTGMEVNNPNLNGIGVPSTPMVTIPQTQTLNSVNNINNSMGVNQSTPVLASTPETNMSQVNVQVPTTPTINLDNLVNNAPVVETSGTIPTVPVVTTPVAPTPAVSVPVATTPAAPAPAVSVPAATAPVAPTPAVSVPVATTPAAPAPAVSVPAATAPVAPTPAVSVPAATTPVAPAPAVSVPTVDASTANETDKKDSKVEINISDNVSVESNKKEKKIKEKKEKIDNNSSDDYDEENIHVSKSPIIIVVLFIIILILIFIYYFLVMTPTKVFDKAINTTIDSVKDLYNDVQNGENKKIDLDLKFDLLTNQNAFKENKRLQDIDRINGDHFESDIKIDLEKENLEFSLKAARSNKKEILDFSVFSVDDNLYVQPRTYYNDQDTEKPFEANNPFSLTNEKIVQADLLKALTGADGNIAYSGEKIDAIIDVAETTKDNILDIIQEDQLKRSIAFKKIGGATTIALKVNCKVDKKDIEDIYYPIFKDYIKNEKIIEKISLATGMDRQDVVNTIQKLIDREVKTEFVDVNLYMNLANTQLVSLDVNVADDFYAQIDYLNGYYSITFTKFSNGKKTFNINATYDSTNGIVEGEGFIDNDNTYLKVVFNYNRVTGLKGNKTGNNLILKFYAHEGTDPFAVLECSLDIITGDLAKLKELDDFVDEKGKLNTEFTKNNVYAIPDVGVSVIGRTPHFRGVDLKESDIPRTNKDLDPSIFKGTLPVLEAADLLVFQFGFKNHVEFVVDHLLHNREMDKPYYEKDNSNSKTEDTKNVEEVKTKEDNKQDNTNVDNSVKDKNQDTNDTNTSNDSTNGSNETNTGNNNTTESSGSEGTNVTNN